MFDPVYQTKYSPSTLERNTNKLAGWRRNRFGFWVTTDYFGEIIRIKTFTSIPNETNRFYISAKNGKLEFKDAVVAISDPDLPRMLEICIERANQSQDTGWIPSYLIQETCLKDVETQVTPKNHFRYPLEGILLNALKLNGWRHLKCITSLRIEKDGEISGISNSSFPLCEMEGGNWGQVQAVGGGLRIVDLDPTMLEYPLHFIDNSVQAANTSFKKVREIHHWTDFVPSEPSPHLLADEGTNNNNGSFGVSGSLRTLEQICQVRDLSMPILSPAILMQHRPQVDHEAETTNPPKDTKQDDKSASLLDVFNQVLTAMKQELSPDTIKRLVDLSSGFDPEKLLREFRKESGNFREVGAINDLFLHEEKPHKLADSSECCICFDKKRDCVILECFHMCTCYNCAQKLDACPICRKKLTEVKRVYLA